MTTVSVRTRRWFEVGHEAFARTFPDVASALGPEPFYFCPLCLRSFDSGALEREWLTQEDVPPRSVGGRRLVLTCAECNHFAGAEMDDHFRRELDVLSFISGKGTIRNRRAVLKTKSGKVPVRLIASAAGYQLHAQPHAAPPGQGDAVKGDFAAAGVGDGWKKFKFKVSLEPYSHPRAEASALRSAYLAFFAALGYRFVFRPELNVVRERIKKPETRTILCRVAMPKPIETPMLVVLRAPRLCFAMLYRFHAVLLPMYGDRWLYEQIEKAAKASSRADMTVTGEFPWPTKPVFRHDELDALAQNPASAISHRRAAIAPKPHATKRASSA